LEPDVVIKINGKPITVGDVNYKLIKDPLSLIQRAIGSVDSVST